MKLFSPPLVLRGAALVLAGLFSSCVSTAADTPKVSPGMTGEEIRARWGAPREVRPMETAQGSAEVWTYRRLVARRTEPVAVATQDVPVFAPGAPNHLSEAPELVYEIETTWVYQDMHLLLFNDVLVSWNEAYERRRRLQR